MEAARSPWPALGVLLVRDGLVSPEELEQVLAAKDGDERLSSRRLGELLVERGLVTTAQVARLVAEQHELPFIDLDDPDATVPLAGHLTEEVARELSALPIRRFPDGSLLVVVADPTPAWIYDEIHRAAGAPVRLAVAAPDGIVAAIDAASAEGRFREPNAPEPGPLVIAGLAEPPLSSDDAEPPAGSWPVLGSLLLRDGLVTKDELEGALAQQRLSSTRRLGEILVQRGALSERQLAQALAEQHELPFVDLAAREIDRIAAARLPLRLAREHCALPVDVLSDGSLLVAVADPTSTFQSTALRAALDVPFLLGVAVPEEIEAAIAALDDESPAPVEPIYLFTGHPVEIVSAPEPDLEPEPEHEPEHEPEPAAESEVPAVPDEIGAAIAALDDEPPAAVEAISLFTGHPVEIVSAPEPDLEPVPEHEPEQVAEPEVPAVPEEIEAAIAALDDEPPARFEPIAVSNGQPVEIAPEPEPDPETEAVHEEESVPELEALAEEELEPEPEVEPEVEPAFHAPEPEQSGAPDLTVLQGGRQDAAPVIRAQIEAALALGASAVHVVTAPDGLVVRARVDGALNEIATVSSLEPESMISALAEVAGLGRTRFTVDGRTVELRPAALPTVLGEHVTFRVVDEGAQAETLDKLFASSDAADALRGALDRPHGLVLLCAATDAERSEALYATLREAAAPGRSVISVEDPVEQLVPGVHQVEVDPRSSVTYATGLHTILRSDADVAAVGELTDHETARLATRGASDRCLVVATIAAKTVADGVRRLLDLGAEPAILAGALACAVATRPLRTLCTECRTSSYATLEELTLLGRPPEESGRRLVARAAGCEACSGNGYAGRARLTEVLPLGEAVTALLAADATRGEIERAAVDAGMRTVLDAVVVACLEGVTSTDEVARLHTSR